jgi:MATE family multidrug resistance protein
VLRTLRGAKGVVLPARVNIMEEPPQPNCERQALSFAHAPTRALLAMAWPITLSGLSFAIMGVVDTAFVASEGAAQLAGVGIGAIVTTGLMGFGFGLLRGVKILLAQSGTSAPAYARAAIGAGLWVALGLGVIMLLLGEVSAFVVPYFAASKEAGDAARDYIAVRSLGAPVILLYVALREARYGLGDTRSPMVSALAGNIAHAGLDYVALKLLGWGASGAAFANVAAFTLQTGMLLAAHRHYGIAMARHELALVPDVLRAGAFTGLQWALEIGALGLLSLLLAGLSDSDMAAHQIAVQLTAFSFLPALAIAEAATVLAGEAVGAGRMALVPRIARSALGLSLAYATFCGFVFVFGGAAIARCFSEDAALVSVATTVLLVAAAHQWLEAAAIAGHGVLRGAGAQRLSAMCAIGCSWGCLPLPALLLTRVFTWGAPGGWLARVFEAVVTFGFVWWQIAKLGWIPAARGAFRAARRARAYAGA